MLPSTSPANAAVPWWDRAHWFFELSARVRGMPPRTGVRAVVLDPADRILLVRFEDVMGSWWATPGGGVDPGESDAETPDPRAAGRGRPARLRARPRPLGCESTGTSSLGASAASAERYYLVRTDAFEIAPSFSEAELAAEGVHEARWFTLDELDGVITGPRRLPELIRDVLETARRRAVRTPGR